jgi:hypothetical protein
VGEHPASPPGGISPHAVDEHDLGRDDREGEHVVRVHTHGSDSDKARPRPRCVGIDDVPGGQQQERGEEDEQAVRSAFLGEKHQQRGYGNAECGGGAESRIDPPAEPAGQPHGDDTEGCREDSRRDIAETTGEHRMHYQVKEWGKPVADLDDLVGGKADDAELPELVHRVALGPDVDEAKEGADNNGGGDRRPTRQFKPASPFGHLCPRNATLAQCGAPPALVS